MRQSIKAALLSGLVFPGLGHIVIGEKKRGWLIAAITLGSLALIINQAIKQASEIVDKMMATNQAPDLDAITRMAEQSTQFSGNLLMNSLLIIIFLCWILGTLDAYRAGSKKDKLAKHD